MNNLIYHMIIIAVVPQCDVKTLSKNVTSLMTRMQLHKFKFSLCRLIYYSCSPKVASSEKLQARHRGT